MQETENDKMVNFPKKSIQFLNMSYKKKSFKRHGKKKNTIDQREKTKPQLSLKMERLFFSAISEENRGVSVDKDALKRHRYNISGQDALNRYRHSISGQGCPQQAQTQYQWTRMPSRGIDPVSVDKDALNRYKHSISGQDALKRHLVLNRSFHQQQYTLYFSLCIEHSPEETISKTFTKP